MIADRGISHQATVHFYEGTFSLNTGERRKFCYTAEWPKLWSCVIC